jgi:hypothetical protein
MKFHVRGQPMFHRPEWTLIVDDPCRRSNVAVHDLHPNFDIQFRQTKGHIEPQTKPIGMTLNYIKFLYVFYVLFPMNIWKKIRFSQFQRSSDPTIHRHLGPIQANAIQLLFHLDHWGRRFPKIGAPQKKSKYIEVIGPYFSTENHDLSMENRGDLGIPQDTT